MLMLEPAAAVSVQISSGNFCRRLSHSAGLCIYRNRVGGLTETSCGKRFWRDKNGIRASAKEQSSSSGSEPVKQSAKPMRYHPFEDIAESELTVNGEARLTPAETTRTIIEVNSKATLMLTGLVSDVECESIFWPDLPFVTDEHGNIYFQVKNEEDILQTLTAEENLVDWVSILDHEDDENEGSEGSLGDWAKLDTMRSSHPMHFARRLTEVVDDDPIDFMELPPAGLAIQGILRPAFLEEHVVIQKQMSDHKTSNADRNQISKAADCKETTIVPINGHRHKSGLDQDNPNWAEELEKDETLGNGTSFYKLEMIKIQLISAHGHQTFVEIEDFRRARPDAIAHSAVKILSRLKTSGEKTIQALKSLCWRCKGIQVEEVSLIGVDSLGIDIRVCSGTQVQTLRFAFKKRASSEYSAERQLNNLLFPRTQKLQQRKEAQQAES
nr:uncharacterized protein At3g49140-like [Ipomoea trifida]GMC61037.1 uncharacterized protein At3g49140-like [Ipomoea batatas]GMC64812.1 uncharacterized protein At3g49140-like [Ipomoea batatas]